MFDAVRNNPKIVQIFLLVISLPFAFFGIDAYFRDRGVGNDVAARVGSVEIVNQQVDQALREQEGVLRERLGAAFDRTMIETPEFRAGVLDRLINETAVRTAIHESRLAVPDGAVQEFIKARPEFQENGQFSIRLYDSVLASQGRSRDSFQQLVRENLAQTQLLMPLVQSAVASRMSSERLVSLDEEQRTVSKWSLEANAFLGDVKLADGAAKKYYDANPSRFQVPEQVKLEYAVLSLNDLAKQQAVSDEDAKKWYDEHHDSYGQPEERRASHILVQVAKSAKPEERAAAKKKAEDLLAKVKNDPSKFAELAKANSDDKVSAARGGDLDFFARDAMVKSFADAAFALKAKEISSVVESEFGYHIIMLTDVRGGRIKSFDEVKADALENARKQAASKRFAELASEFGDKVYEEPDALKPIAEKFKLKLVQTDWLSRAAMPDGVLQNPKLQAALFSADSLNNHRNTEAIDLGDGSIVSARVLEHKPSAVQPFEAVRASVEALVKAEEATKLAKANGEELLAKLKSGESPAGSAWKASGVMKRSTRELSAQARKAVFSASAAKLPAYAGVADDQAYVLYRVDAVNSPKIQADDARVKEMRQRHEMVLGEEDLRAYVAGVRERLGVKLHSADKKKD